MQNECTYINNWTCNKATHEGLVSTGKIERPFCSADHYHIEAEMQRQIACRADFMRSQLRFSEDDVLSHEITLVSEDPETCA